MQRSNAPQSRKNDGKRRAGLVETDSSYNMRVMPEFVRIPGGLVKASSHGLWRLVLYIWRGGLLKEGEEDSQNTKISGRACIGEIMEQKMCYEHFPEGKQAELEQSRARRRASMGNGRSVVSEGVVWGATG